MLKMVYAYYMARKATKPESSSKTINIRMRTALARRIAALAKSEHRSQNAQIIHMLELTLQLQGKSDEPAPLDAPARDNEASGG